MSAPNPYLVAGRLNKALKLAQLLRRHSISTEALRSFEDADWQKLATAAGVNLPSEETRVLTVRQLERFEEPLDWERISA